MEPGSTDWNLLEEMIQRLGVEAVREAVDQISEQDDDDDE